MTTRSTLYRLASALGWAQAAQRGRLPERAFNVLLGRAVGRLLQRLYR